MFGLSTTDAEKVQSAPRWRLTLRPKDEAAAPAATGFPGVHTLPPRVLTLSHIHELGRRVAAAIGAQEPYQLRLDSSNSSRLVTWTELRTVIPEELTPLTITATGHLLDHPDNTSQGTHNQQAEITLFGNRAAHLRVSGSPQALDDQHRYTTIADALAAYFASLGRARRDHAWLIPALFWIGIAVAALPLIWLTAVGRLPWQAVPFFAATGYVAAAYLSEQVARWSDRRRPERMASVVDTRPIEEVRRELEAQRQKRRITWITVLITGPVTAALGALLAFLLK